jgi:hypothetical protein
MGLAAAVPVFGYDSRTVYDDATQAPASDSTITPANGADGYYYGRVLYTHGGGIDAPLSVTRMEYSDSLSAPMTVFLHRDWRGTHDLDYTRQRRTVHRSVFTTGGEPMRPLIRRANLLMALISVSAAILVALFVPEVWARRTSEPEDAFVLGIWWMITLAFALISWLSFRQLAEERHAMRASRSITYVNFTAAAICLIGAVIGVSSNEPSSRDLALLIVPATLFATNGWSFRRRQVD